MSFITVVVFCVFKQKTAYEMRISDWSSDVCSSDLGFDAVAHVNVAGDRIGASPTAHAPEERVDDLARCRRGAVGHAGKAGRGIAEQDAFGLDDRPQRPRLPGRPHPIGTASRRDSGWQFGLITGVAVTITKNKN